ncbi:putative diacyglycerol O-acyltransferase tgs1 [Mycobacterium sp. MFM001]|uniref:WS/DGAT/MGAT family O-acyltransferase n=1 Tax=Mycobacterium sp. MFM001 TaxID=2049453 RepID=UPI000DA48F68|nr:wax ester/triacylglycerol synthase family O-acyltransferase [Mycobacterium sp. MFM001]GBE64352.1 putative diacyglycerol O-acyltransferase tgs1 [Mycobacterium sp. MFM001]
MEHLTTLDAGFLKAEDSDPRVSLAIGGLALLEGPVPDRESLTKTLSQRIRTCPRFKQRLRLRVFDLGAPEWVDDPDFDLAHHVRRIAVPRPGDNQELFRLVADVMSRRLDRSRPLWEIWVIEGLAEDRWAMLMKIHHAIADGIATAHMLAGLSDRGVANSFAGQIRAAKEPAAPPFRLPGAITDPLSWMSGLWTTSASMTTAAARAARGAAELAIGLLRPASSSLNGPVSDLRRYSAARVSLDDIRQVCRAFDVTINDVALAALTESYRTLLIRRGERPSADSLRALVPVSVRAADALAAAGNRVSVMLPYLPVEIDNPVQRLRVVHSRLSRTKSSGQRQAGSTAVSVANAVPFPLTAWLIRWLTQLPQHGVTTLATNVPGPCEPLHIMGRKVIAVMPVPPIAMQLRTGVAMLSYADDLFFGILADFDAVPEVDEIARGIEAAVARLVAGSKRRKTAYGRRGLSLVINA